MIFFKTHYLTVTESNYEKGYAFSEDLQHNLNNSILCRLGRNVKVRWFWYYNHEYPIDNSNI